jgi:serine/threonine protein kinase
MAAAKNPLKAYSNKEPLKKSDFVIGATLGTGSFGRVRLVTHKQSESVWALKVLPKADVFRLKQVEHVLNERHLLSRLKHPNAVSLGGAFQDERCLYLVLSFAVGGELYRHLRTAQRFENNVAKFYAAQVRGSFVRTLSLWAGIWRGGGGLEGRGGEGRSLWRAMRRPLPRSAQPCSAFQPFLHSNISCACLRRLRQTKQVVAFFEYFHSLDYAYRDLKPENVLLDHQGYVKICDFGFAKKVPFKTYTLCGTPEYMAPEVILSSGHGQGIRII